MIYNLINPSDAITFKSDSDKIAFVCALILGSGKFGMERADNKEVQSPLLFLSEDSDAIISEYLQSDLKEFCKQNKLEISNCFESFCYGSIRDRQTYDDAIEAIDDFDKLQKFKLKHEDTNRTSASKWILCAWEYAKHFKDENYLINE